MLRRRTGPPFLPIGWEGLRSVVLKFHVGMVLAGLLVLSAGGFFLAGPARFWLFGIWAAGILWCGAALGLRYLRRAAADRRSHLEFLLLLILGINLLTQWTGGVGSPFMLLYMFLLLFSSFARDNTVNGAAVSAIWFLEGFNWAAASGSAEIEWGRALMWAVGLGLIPLVVKTYLHAERREKEELRAAVLRFRSSAQVINPPPAEIQPARLWAQTPDERDRRSAPLHFRFDQAIENLFWLLKGALPKALHCVLFLPGEAEGRFHMYKTVGGDVRELRPQFILAEGEGVLGFALKERRLYRLGNLNPDHGFLGYCARTLRVRSLLVGPILQDDRLEGVLVVDSLQAEAFGEEDEQVFIRTQAQVLQAIESNRRTQAAITRTHELSTLMSISESLGSKLDLDHRLETMASKIKEIIPYDHCFIFLMEGGERRAELKVVRGYTDPKLKGQSIPLHDGLISVVVRQRLPLIKKQIQSGDRWDSVFPTGSGIHLKPGSFIGLPMIAQDRVIGVLAMTSWRPNAFDDQHKDFLATLCSQAAISIADAKLHDDVNRLATTDGLTGVANHRRFQERLNEEFERQAREGGTFTLVMIDVDHFKRVNDRFGHPSGDKVLRQVAGILVKGVRKIDIVARYGGEEFAVVLLNIGAKEAFALAERIRKSVEALEPVINGEPQTITISLGMAVYPQDARDRQSLIERADQALYAAKHGGRNRTYLFSKIKV